ncbi:MAG: AbrB family transcriptional regulator [Candidatus Lokiarchaeota archaeon]|nr:AbrB family transcriptional regulator [Candidatus Lokiarchaeota archaeon]
MEKNGKEDMNAGNDVISREMITTHDEKGRVYIPKKFQEKLTKRMFIIDTPEGLLLVPLPDDPVATLKEMGKSLPAMTLKQFKSEIMKQAAEELENKL